MMEIELEVNGLIILIFCFRYDAGSNKRDKGNANVHVTYVDKIIVR